MTQTAILRSLRPGIYWVGTLPRPASAERRVRTRFSVDLPFRYQTLGRKRLIGEGRVVNLSSGGALLACCHELAADTPIELTIEWPARADQKIPVRLVMAGIVVRCDGSGFAVASSLHRFVFASPTSPAEGVVGTSKGDLADDHPWSSDQQWPESGVSA